MKKLFEKIKKKIIDMKIEHYSNFVFEIKHKDTMLKDKIKKCLIQGDLNTNHTIITFDFVNKNEKISKKQKRLDKIYEVVKSSNIAAKKYHDSISLLKEGKNDTDENLNNDDYFLNSNSLLKEGENDTDENLNNDDYFLNSNLKLKDFFILDEYPNIIIYNSPIYICGRYIKNNRMISQTPLVIKGQLKLKYSVSDFIYEFQKFYSADSVKFMASGREDIDVKCIKGRPFILEIKHPKINLRSNQMDIRLYETVDIIETFITNRDCLKVINEDCSEKSYLLLIYSENKIDFLKEYSLKQKTPLRVLHRRSNEIRTKRINVLESEEYFVDGEYYYKVFVRASSGTYIKEWVNGDCGRTSPNLNSDLLELDVYSIDKKIEEKLLIEEFKLNKTFVSWE